MGDRRSVFFEIGGEISSEEHLQDIFDAINDLAMFDDEPSTSVIAAILAKAWAGNCCAEFNFESVNYGNTETLDAALDELPWRKLVAAGDDNGWMVQCNMPGQTLREEQIYSINDNGNATISAYDLLQMKMMDIMSWANSVTDTVPPISFSGDAKLMLARIIGEAALTA